jgi:polysaccharide biosynthesis protein PslJ
VTQLAEPPLLAPSNRPIVAVAGSSARRLPAGWPLAALLCFYPLWWAIGIGQFAFMIFSVPMVVHLWRRRPLRLPPAFGLWMLFLIWYVLCLVMLPAAAPGSTSGTISGRAISILIEIIQLAGATVALLYVGNLSTSELSQRRLQKWLSVLFLVTVAGGLLALAFPYFQFTAPLEHLLPRSIRANTYALSIVHPNAAQVQDVLGYTSPRPAAPWSFTNYWANNLSILLVWFCLYMWSPARFRRRAALIVAMAATIVTVVYSLNRGLWIGLIGSVAFLIVSLARRGDLRSTFAALAMIPIMAVAFLATPLHTVVGARASHGGSNDIRSFLDADAFKGALASPIVGWGGTRKALGSSQSIAVGPSTNCPGCGAFTIGSTGEIWQVMYSEGLLGALLYVGFFIALWWRLRKDTSAIGAGARLIIWLTLLYSLFYNNLPVALTLVMISVGMSWRNLIAAEASAPIGASR